MKKTREQIQQEAKQAWYDNNKVGTLDINTGGGKSKVPIDIIKEQSYQNILITSPRTNLKNNWRKELEKWGFKFNITNRWNYPNSDMSVNIQFINIQTCYKWSKEQLSKFDFIIVDEIHLVVTEEYRQLILKARDLNIPIIGLTATPDDDKLEKRAFYETFIPIIYTYKDGAEDGIINKRRHLVYQYELNDINKIPIVTAKKSFLAGEKKQYEYYDQVMKESSDFIKNHYFESMKKRYSSIKIMREAKYPKDYITFLNDALSKDLEYFYSVTKPRYEEKSLPIDLYWLVKEVKGFNYSFLGLNAQKLVSNKSVPQEIKPYLFKYIYGMTKRKEFLWNLNSTAVIARQLKDHILKLNNSNKVLIFSERTEHVEKITNNTIHSKKHLKKNAELLEKFNNNEIRELGSCHSLGLGLNLKNPNYEIIESFSGSKVSLTQRLGRSDRLEVDDIAIIIILVPKDTQASVWFESATIDIENIEYYSNLKELIKNL